MSFPTWNTDWFPLPGQAVFDRNTQKIAAVSRAPGNLDLFVIGNDSHVWTTAWSSATNNWNTDWRPLPGRAVFDLNTQHVAAVSRAPDHLDLLVIGNDGGVGTTNGHVWTTAWSSATNNWNTDWRPLPGQAVFDRNTQKIAAISRAPGNLDLFVIGNDSHVWTTAWSSATGWNTDWRPLPGRAVTATRNMSPRFHELRAILTCSSSETTAASEPPMVTSGPRPGAVPLAGTRTGGRFPGKRCLTVTRNRSPPFHGLRAILTCSSSETTVTSGPRPGVAPLTTGTRTGGRFPGKRCLTATRNMSPRFHELRAILTCSSSETTAASEPPMVTSGPRPGAVPLAGTRTGARFRGKQHVTATRNRSPPFQGLRAILTCSLSETTVTSGPHSGGCMQPIQRSHSIQ